VTEAKTTHQNAISQVCSIMPPPYVKTLSLGPSVELDCLHAKYGSGSVSVYDGDRRIQDTADHHDQMTSHATLQ